jgi:hypothetical protein
MQWIFDFEQIIFFHKKNQEFVAKLKKIFIIANDNRVCFY